jgi:hypothetical protein
LIRNQMAGEFEANRNSGALGIFAATGWSRDSTKYA